MTIKKIRKYGILFYEDSCPHCNKYLHFISRVNSNVSLSNKIRLVNCEYAKYGIIDPRFERYEKHISGFPTLILIEQFKDIKTNKTWDVLIKKTGINSIIESKTFLESYLNDVYVVPEHNKYLFDKECYVQQKGKLKGEIICR